MAGPSRIDELRKKFDENPRRYFAPLANEYRKLGDFDQAIFICQEFLPQQPGHMSGHIVYGQALFESGRHDEARVVFETALALDPENLIALRHLGDIARAHGDNDTARAWYRRVLESDPRNEEIAGILSSLDTDEAAPAAPAAAPAPEAAASAPDVSGDKLETQSAMSSAAPQVAAAPPSPDPIVDEPLTSAPSESTFDELAKLFTSSEPAPPAAPAEAPAEPPPGDSLGLIHEGEDVLGRAAQMQERPEPSAIDGVGTARSEGDAGTADAGTFSAPFLEALGSAPPAAPPASPAPPAPVEEPPPARETTADASTAFVTETMAELYLKQGHHELAIGVYRQLVALHPDDAALRARLAELEQAAAPPPAVPSPAVAEAGPTIRDFLASIAEFRPRAGANGASVPEARAPAPVADRPAADRAASERREDATVGTSLHSLFVDAESERGQPGGAPTAPADLPFLDESQPPAKPENLGGKPASPAPNDLSLDHVFRHATPAAGAATQPPSFSFDQFFSQKAHQDVSPAESESSGEGSSGPSDDIQQFNAWLEGLKKT